MTDDQSVDYSLLGAQLDALLKDESDALANAAIFVALVFDAYLKRPSASEGPRFSQTV